MHPLLQSVVPASDFSVALPSLGILQIKGPDAAKFLQGQITQDVVSMTVGEQRLSACCNPQGRMRAVFRVIKQADDMFLLLMPRAIISAFSDAIKKYAAFFKAQLDDVSPHWRIVGQYHVNIQPSPTDASATVVTVDDHRSFLLIPGHSTDETADETRWQALDIIHRNAWVWPQTIEKLLPHEIGLKDVGGISFTKGCYTGQEIVARMEYRGKLKNGIAIAFCALTDRVEPGSEVYIGESLAGEVLGASRHPIAGQLLLLNLKDANNVEPLTLNLPSRPILQLLS